MSKHTPTLLQYLGSFLGACIFIVMAVFAIIMFSYLFIIGAVIGLVIFLCLYLRIRWLQHKYKHQMTAAQAKRNDQLHHGRTIDQ